VLLVSCADKLHNVRSIAGALREHGEGVWHRFNGGKDGTLWYYRELKRAYEQRGTPLFGDYMRALADLEVIARKV
jgi:GTP pyrophosphokinase